MAEFTRYQKVICNGYPGTVQRKLEGTSMYDVRVPGGLTCVCGSELRDLPETTKIDGRTYTVEITNTGSALRLDLVNRGFDGQCYILKGKRSAVRLAYQSFATGEFVIVEK